MRQQLGMMFKAKNDTCGIEKQLSDGDCWGRSTVGFLHVLNEAFFVRLSLSGEESCTG